MNADLKFDLIIVALGIGLLLAYRPARRVFFDLFREPPPLPELDAKEDQVLDVVAKAERGMTMGAIAAELLMPPDEAYRIVLLLVQSGDLVATEIEGDVLISLG